MLSWEEQLRSEVNINQTKHNAKFDGPRGPLNLGEVVVICWPNGEIMRLKAGSSAVDAAQRTGLEGKLVLINGHLALPNTKLKDGDVLEVRI